MIKEIRRVRDPEQITAAAQLFDSVPDGADTARFVSSSGHHLLLAYDDAGRPVGMVSGVELTHPDKGTEMLLYELGVDESARAQGVGTALAGALAELARERGCYGMWVAVDADNVPALRTYRRAGASREDPCVILSWDF